jgi:hypothetical protein
MNYKSTLIASCLKMAYNSLIREQIVSLCSYQKPPSVSL